MNLVDELLKLGAKAVLETENVSTEIAEWRMSICRKCPNFNADKVKCNVCGCYLEVKTECKTNYNPKKLRHEVTHCPLGFWGDLETANEYRKIDGLPSLTNK